MFLAPWLFLIDDEIKANVATSLLEQLLILIAQGQTQILPNTWNLLKILKKKKKGNLPAMQSVEKQAGSLEEAWW